MINIINAAHLNLRTCRYILGYYPSVFKIARTPCAQVCATHKIRALLLSISSLHSTVFFCELQKAILFFFSCVCDTHCITSWVLFFRVGTISFFKRGLCVCVCVCVCVCFDRGRISRLALQMTECEILLLPPGLRASFLVFLLFFYLVFMEGDVERGYSPPYVI